MFLLIGNEFMKEILRKILYKIIPELEILKSPYFSSINMDSTICNVVKGSNVRLYPIYHLYNVKIGNNTYISFNSYITHTDIGHCCSIGPNLICGWGIHPLNGISTSPMFYSTQKQNGMTLASANKIEERKPIVIGNDVFIGANVTILDGVKIGDGAVIGAGAVVSKDIPPYAIAVGNPIKIIRYRMSEGHINAMRRIQWWNWDEENLKEVEKMFFDIEKFIVKFDISDTK